MGYFVNILQSSDWLSLAAVCFSVVEILVTGCVAIWIVKTLQCKIDNQKVLKEHLCSEVIELRDDYRLWISKLSKEPMLPQNYKRSLSRLSHRVNDLMKLITSQFVKIDADYLYPYQIDILGIIEDDSNINKDYKKGGKISLSEDSIDKILDFESHNSHLFNDLYITIFQYE